MLQQKRKRSLGIYSGICYGIHINREEQLARLLMSVYLWIVVINLFGVGYSKKKHL